MPAGFPQAEYHNRTTQVQARMVRAGFAALLVTTEADLRYFSGFMTRFWESPTRPWFLIVPAEGAPIAVIPSIGAALMRGTWIKDIRTWRAPDYQDDGVSVLADALREVTDPGSRIATPGGTGTHIRMPWSDWQRLTVCLQDRSLCDDAGLMCAQRQVKSDAEITKIAASCAVADRVFARVPEIAPRGEPLSAVFRRFQMLCLEEGADWVPYLAGGAGRGGYVDVISPATETPLAPGDVLMLDTGLMRDGYFCDFDRNFSLGMPSPATRAAYAKLVEATQAAFEIAKPGATAADLFNAIDRIVTAGAGGSDTGRLGHGLGMQLTEQPSLIPEDHTPLAPGMVLTLEPGIDVGEGRILVHEENIVIREHGAEWLSKPSGPEMVVIDA